MDDTFCLFNNEHDAMQFFDYLNTKHPNIRFTFEKEINGKLSFLDVLIDNSKDKLVTSIFHKKTYTGLLTNFLSFIPFRYKSGLIKTLIDRTFKINNTSNGFRSDLNDLTETLKRNSYPAHVIDNTVKRYNNAVQNNNASLSVSSDETSNDVHYFLKLPYTVSVISLKLLNVK